MRKIILIVVGIVLLSSCISNSNHSHRQVKTIEVNPEHFIQDNLLKEITKEVRDINGVETLCYVITSSSMASEHQMGPWCPRHIDDAKDKGGIWFKDDKVYDVNGHFIANLAEFYNCLLYTSPSPRDA